MKVAVVLGTRPEIIKMSPVVRELEARGIDHFVLHTGQHYSHNMDRVFFEVLRLRPPRHNLNVGSGTHGEETGRMLMGIERVLAEEKPDYVLVEGDTNTVLAGTLAASKMRIKVGHVEAGLRSGDMSMPEEINRIVADHVSDILFAPTEVSMQNLLREGLDQEKIRVTGNTIVDAVNQNLSLTEGRDIRSELCLDRYFLATVHRQENVDSPERLRRILGGLELVSKELGREVVYPVHPRARKRISAYGLHVGASVRMVDPVDYLTFLMLERGADLILTDSGGVQEEACILGVPCVTLRDNTERPETVEVGANVLSGTDPQRILDCAREMLRANVGWQNPFGDGNSAKRIVDSIER
ncbi:MAG: UDP-N-acetylglucosamine 2-epimerase (non-hydrolyzing) [Candidatus Verstraetearchaeota archaeon]|nr:UDP-N-acetylglucosamine 2-epimerase (non-hydrolyzing) [Candidatus Verstraetearchaeota archaeon]